MTSIPLQDAEAQRLADAVEAAGCRDLYDAAPANLQASFQVRAGATALYVPSVPVSYMNRIVGLGMDTPATEDALDALTAPFKAARTPFWIHVNPTARPEALTTWLTQRGFKLARRRSWARFLRGPEPPPPVDTRVEVRLARANEGEIFADIVCTAYEFPPAMRPWIAALVGRKGWEVFLGIVDGKPVAAGSLFRHEDAGWLGMGATLAEYRGRGAQSALLAARIAAGRDCRVLVTETGEPIADEPNPSFNNIQRSGFVKICSRLNYASPA